LLRITHRDGEPLCRLPAVRERIAALSTELEAATVLQRRVIAAAMKGHVPTVEAAMYKLCGTELGRRMADAALEMLGPEGLLAHGAPGAPADGKWEHSWRATVVDTIGGGSSEVQKNIIARRGLGLPLA
jgi:alkylation response protein AidB-like acyl-CoA dehydrogenase